MLKALVGTFFMHSSFFSKLVLGGGAKEEGGSFENYSFKFFK